MTTSTAIVQTEHASRYLQQLCKHFGHKVPVDFSTTEGRVTLPFGACHMTADQETLRLSVEGSAAEIPKLERVLGDHLARFAFRENPKITWIS